MKIIILGFDALDIEIVENEGLDGLQQNFYGFIDVSEFEYADSIFWSTFLTGKDPDEHKMYYLATSGNRVIEWFKQILFEKKIKHSTVRKIERFTKPFFKMIGITSRLPDMRDLKQKTIFDLVERPLPINVLMYNKWIEFSELRARTIDVLNKAFRDLELTEKLVDDWRNMYFKQKKEVIKSLNEEWDIIMTHVYITDAAGHLYSNQYNKYIDICKELNEFIKEVDEIAQDSAMIMVVSDHGMKKGAHQPRAFYSFNKEPPFIPEKMTDYYEIIRQIVLT